MYLTEILPTKSEVFKTINVFRKNIRIYCSENLQNIISYLKVCDKVQLEMYHRFVHLVH